MSSLAPSSAPLGLIGLGLMGQALAGRLLAHGFEVVGFDLAANCVDRFVTSGGRAARDVSEVADRAPVILLSLPDHQAVAGVMAEMLPGIRAGRIVIDTTTGDPKAAAKLGDELAGHGVDYLDAAISGSSAQVSRGEVLVIAGGSERAFRYCGEVFACFANDAVHAGPCGCGTRMKLVTNLVLGLNRAALAEGLAFASLLDLDGALTLDIMRRSMAYSRIMDTKGEKMVVQDFTPQARLSQHLKDVRLILAASPVPLPLSETHGQLLEKAVALGLGDLDNSAIIKAILQP